MPCHYSMAFSLFLDLSTSNYEADYLHYGTGTHSDCHNWHNATVIMDRNTNEKLNRRALNMVF
jgi:hypothetical protein